MDKRIITPVAVEPVSMAEAKLHLRLTEIADDQVEDSLIQGLIVAAREYCEGYTDRALATQTIDVYFDCFSGEYMELPFAPLQSVTSVTVKDSNGDETVLVEDTDYLVDAISTVGRIVRPYGESWYNFTEYPINPITVRIVAGYTTTYKIPSAIKQAMLLLVGHWYLNREAVGTVGGDIKLTVDALLSMYRLRWL